jgi:nitric oxide reductase subunit C
MLSKSAARAFFIAGTVVSSAAFIALTIDTFGRIPAQTHADQITDAVARGKEVWDSSNCMGCHTLLGEGAYYAPELTQVFRRRGPEFIRAMLRDPEKMYPGQRKMQNYHLAEAQISDLVAFFAWIDKIDLNGFPPTPTLMQVAVPAIPGKQAIATGARADRSLRGADALKWRRTRHHMLAVRR